MKIICWDGQSQWTADSVTDAWGIQLATTTTDFVSALVITNSSLKYLTSNFQAEARDVVRRSVVSKQLCRTSERTSLLTTLSGLRRLSECWKV